PGQKHMQGRQNPSKSVPIILRGSETKVKTNSSPQFVSLRGVSTQTNVLSLDIHSTTIFSPSIQSTCELSANLWR
ncbi:MAG: hypothetical protein ACPIOQ_51960, partial [Promethearchaeia archaeon]